MFDYVFMNIMVNSCLRYVFYSLCVLFVCVLFFVSFFHLLSLFLCNLTSFCRIFNKIALSTNLDFVFLLSLVLPFFFDYSIIYCCLNKTIQCVYQRPQFHDVVLILILSFQFCKSKTMEML